MKLRKLITVLCVLVLCFSVGAAFAGCGTEYTSEIDWDVDVTDDSKRPTMSMMYPNAGINEFENNRTTQLIEKYTGYKGSYVQLTSGNEDNEVSKALTSRAEYDIMKLTQAQYDPYVENGTWLDLTKLLTETESGKILYDIIALLPNAWDSVTYTNEKGEKGIYAIPECGYYTMEDGALVWNTAHLKEIGWYDNHTDIPQTLGEFDDAVKRLQAHFGANDKNYYALGLGGNNDSNVEPIMTCFDVPNQFYLDGNNKIQQYVYHDGVTEYVSYMSSLRKANIISPTWQSSSSADIISKFSTQKSSVMSMTYWWVKTLTKTMAANSLPSKFGHENSDAGAREMLGWSTRLRGDGTNGSVEQAKGKHFGGEGGNAYYIVIPNHMAKNAVWTIDYISKKLQNYKNWYAGEEGTEWERVDAPADGKENYGDKIIYLQPWTYNLNGTAQTGGGHWVKLKQSYMDNIENNSMYALGSNVVEARSLFHMRETSFSAWTVAAPYDDSIIPNPMDLHPTFKWWSPISIQARTFAKRGIAQAIDSDDPVGSINTTRGALKETKYSRINGVRYYYWSDDISNEMSAWYAATKGNK